MRAIITYPLLEGSYIRVVDVCPLSDPPRSEISTCKTLFTGIAQGPTAWCGPTPYAVGAQYVRFAESETTERVAFFDEEA